MKYRLLNNKKGVLLTRAPEEIGEHLRLTFEGPDEKMQAVINTGDRVIYRDLHGGECEIHRDLIEEGRMLLSVRERETSSTPVVCDRLFIIRTGDVLIVMGDELEREAIIAGLRIENDELNTRLADAEEKIKQLTERLEEIYDGYELL